jgi:hypothetical protein
MGAAVYVVSGQEAMMMSMTAHYFSSLLGVVRESNR